MFPIIQEHYFPDGLINNGEDHNDEVHVVGDADEIVGAVLEDLEGLLDHVVQDEDDVDELAGANKMVPPIHIPVKLQGRLIYRIGPSCRYNWLVGKLWMDGLREEVSYRYELLVNKGRCYFGAGNYDRVLTDGPTNHQPNNGPT